MPQLTSDQRHGLNKSLEGRGLKDQNAGASSQSVKDSQTCLIETYARVDQRVRPLLQQALAVFSVMLFLMFSYNDNIPKF